MEKIMNYLYIRAWGKVLGSYSNYVESQIREATLQNAPENAIYKSADGRWQTADKIVSEPMRNRIELMVSTAKANIKMQAES